MAIQPFATQIVAPQFESPAAVQSNVLALRQRQQENAMRQMDMQQLQQQQTRRNELLDIYRGGGDIQNRLMQGGFVPEAQQFGKMSREEEDAQIKRTYDQLDMARQILTSAVDEPSYQQAIAQAKRLGLPTQDAPAAFDPTWVQGQIQMATPVLERLKLAQQQRTAAIQEAQLGMRERELGQPPKPEAPTMTEVVDPSDPTRMLRVDAKTYRGGSLGSAGVLGVSGKEPAAAKAAEKAGEGQELFDTQVGEIRRAYDTLFKLKAIPSTTFSAAENAKIAAQTSGPGQQIGRVFGTKAQSQRNIVSNARVMLLNAVKQATGMAAQQLNSNVELQTYMQALTDPSKDYESNLQTLDNLENWVKARQTSAKNKTTTPSKRTVLRTGTDKRTGRKVIQYSDGAVEYAD
jgi:hypothetical protein